MPDRPVFAARAADILAELQAMPTDILDRRAVQKLLDLKPRRALQVMQVAGAEPMGNTLVVGKDNLAQYLQRYADEGAVEERARRVRFAKVLGKLERDRVENPPLLVEIPKSVVREICHRSLDRLPEESILLEPGKLTIAFVDGKDLLEKLAKLSAAVAVNMENFLKQTEAKAEKSRSA